MALREWSRWLPPPRALAALVLAAAGLSARLAACSVARCSTLEVDTWYSLCRLLALLTAIVEYRVTTRSPSNERCSRRQARSDQPGEVAAAAEDLEVEQAGGLPPPHQRHLHLEMSGEEGHERETRLRNTFGWARIEVVGRLAVHVLFTSLGLSLLVQALQHAVHSSHAPARPSSPAPAPAPPCLPFPQLIIAVALGGLVEHLLTYLLLAGQELGSGRRLSMTESGVKVKSGGKSQALAHTPANVVSSLFVLAAGLVSQLAQPCEPAELFRLVDPALTGLASVVLVLCNYPYMREAGLVLLQTVPEGLGTADLKVEAERVPGVLAIHELHVWQLYPKCVIATAHIFYTSHLDFRKSSALVAEVFDRYGISRVTLQPEFASNRDSCCAEDLKQLQVRLRESCSSACAAHCTAARCCRPFSLPAPAPAPAPDATPPHAHPTAQDL